MNYILIIQTLLAFAGIVFYIKALFTLQEGVITKSGIENMIIGSSIFILDSIWMHLSYENKSIIDVTLSMSLFIIILSFVHTKVKTK